MSRTRIRRLLPVFAALAGGLRCSDGVTVPSEGRPSDITVVAGNGQQGVVGQQLSDALVIRLTDSQDRPVQGQRILFKVVAGGAGAALVPDTVVTDADGVASSAWRLGGEAGQQKVEASSGSLSAEFAATASAEAADTIFAVEGQDQTGIVRGLLSDSLVVVVLDRFGNPLAGQSVEWRVPSGEGSVSADQVTTGVDGRAAVARILGSRTGAQSTRASVSSLAGQTVLFRHTAISGHAVDLVRLSADNQAAPSGSQLADAVVVQAQDAEGNGVPGEVITWVPSQGGSVTPRSVTTDAAGLASTRWTLSSGPGANTLTAAGFGATIEFHATGTSSAPDTLRALSPVSFTGTSGQPVSPGQRPSVRVSDTEGKPVQGVSVTFTVTQGGGTLSDGSETGTSVTVATGSNGAATVSGWTLGPGAGTNVVTAQAARPGGGALQGSPVSFTASAQAGSAARLVFGQQPGNTPAAGVIAPAVTVVIQDENGNPITTSTASVTIALGNNPGGGTLSGDLTASPVNGVVTFPDLSIDRSGSGYTLVAKSAGVTDVFSNQFDVLAAPASRLQFVTQPSNAAAGASIAPAIRVAIQDQQGNTVTTATDSVRLSLNPGTGNLGGVVAVKAVNGVATFDQVTVGVSGTGYTLTAIAPQSPLVSVTSSAFSVTSSKVTVAINSDAPDPSMVGQTYTVSFAVTGSSGTPTGTVTVSDGSAECSGTLNGGSGSCALASTTAGAKNLTATYSGDSSFDGGSSSPEPHSVNQGPPPALHLVFTAQPSDVARGMRIRPKVMVAVYDSNGELVANARNTITVKLGNNPLNLAQLNGKTSKDAKDGVAEFDDLTVTGLTLFNNLTLIASSPGMPDITSATFNVR